MGTGAGGNWKLTRRTITSLLVQGLIQVVLIGISAVIIVVLPMINEARLIFVDQPLPSHANSEALLEKRGYALWARGLWIAACIAILGSMTALFVPRAFWLSSNLRSVPVLVGISLLALALLFAAISYFASGIASA